MAEPADDPGSPAGDAEPDGAPPVDRQPGWPEVLLIGATIVVVVLVVATITLIVPDLRVAIGRLPLLILVLIGGTALVVWRILRTPTGPR